MYKLIVSWLEYLNYRVVFVLNKLKDSIKNVGLGELLKWEGGLVVCSFFIWLNVFLVYF